MESILEIRLGEINSKEDLSIRLGDALDMKASIGLAVILFLATQTAYLFDKGLPPYGYVLQQISIGCVVLAALFALLELWPIVYGLPQPESPVIADRLKELKGHYAAYPNADMNVSKCFMEDEMEWAKSRIADNQKKNRWKSSMLALSFCFTGVSVSLNLLTVYLFLLKPNA